MLEVLGGSMGGRERNSGCHWTHWCTTNKSRTRFSARDWFWAVRVAHRIAAVEARQRATASDNCGEREGEHDIMNSFASPPCDYFKKELLVVFCIFFCAIQKDWILFSWFLKLKHAGSGVSPMGMFWLVIPNTVAENNCSILGKYL